MLKPNNLQQVVSDHIDDLERCIPVLREFGLGPTADEFVKAIGELREAIRASRVPAAYVPVHPRIGPLWANTITSLEQDRPIHYPLMPVYI